MALIKTSYQKPYISFRFVKNLFKNLKYNLVGNMNEEVKTEDGFVIIKEGKAEILQKHDEKVFYNPVQEFNRDLR